MKKPPLKIKFMAENNKGTMIPALAEKFASIAGADTETVQETLEGLHKVTVVLGFNGKDLMSPQAFDAAIKQIVTKVNENNF